MAKILLADDDSSLVKILRTRLSAVGHEVIEANDGYFAVARFESEHPDLLILDVNMPAGDGFSVHERVGDHVAAMHVPVIYVTGRSDEALQEHADRHGAFALVRKPFHLDELLLLVEEALAERSAA